MTAIVNKIILENYRAAFRRANGRAAKLYMHRGWVYLDDRPYRPKALVRMTAVLNERAAKDRVLL